MKNGKWSEVSEYKGWQDNVVKLIPHETYVRLAKFKGVEFYGTPFFMSYFIPPQKGSPLEGENIWEAHWDGNGSALHCYRAAKKSLAEFYKRHYNTKLVGLIDSSNKKAAKMARLLGFWPTGQFIFYEGTCYVLSIKEGE